MLANIVIDIFVIDFLLLQLIVRICGGSVKATKIVLAMKEMKIVMASATEPPLSSLSFFVVLSLKVVSLSLLMVVILIIIVQGHHTQYNC